MVKTLATVWAMLLVTLSGYLLATLSEKVSVRTSARSLLRP